MEENEQFYNLAWHHFIKREKNEQEKNERDDDYGIDCL